MTDKPFFIGQRVRCIATNATYDLVVGKIYTVAGVAKVCSCNEWNIQVNGMYGIGAGTRCSRCKNTVSIGGLLWFRAIRFEPVDDEYEILYLKEEKALKI